MHAQLVKRVRRRSKCLCVINGGTRIPSEICVLKHVSLMGHTHP